LLVLWLNIFLVGIKSVPYHLEKDSSTPTSQGCIGIKDTGCIQHPMWVRQGLYWTKRSIHPNPNQRAQ